MKISLLVSKIIDFILLILFFSLIAVVTLQIIGRFSILKTPRWTEEVSRFLMVYIVSAGVGKATRSGALIRVDAIDYVISSNKLMVMRNIFYKVLSIILMIISTYYGFIFFLNGKSQFAASINLPMSYVFVSMIFLPISILIIYLYEILIDIKSLFLFDIKK